MAPHALTASRAMELFTGWNRTEAQPFAPGNPDLRGDGQRKAALGSEHVNLPMC